MSEKLYVAFLNVLSMFRNCQRLNDLRVRIHDLGTLTLSFRISEAFETLLLHGIKVQKPSRNCHFIAMAAIQQNISHKNMKSSIKVFICYFISFSFFFSILHLVICGL